MTWAHRIKPEPPDVHYCDMPTESVPQVGTVASGDPGDVWRCDDCRRLWVRIDGGWKTASRLQRFRHRRDGYPPKPPYDVVNDDGSVTHYSSEREQNAGRAGVYTVAPPRATPPPPPPPSYSPRRSR